MKHLSLYLLVFVFIANTMVASVWVQPCMMEKDSIYMQSDVSMLDEMPCHDEQEQQKQDLKCEDLCLYLNVLVSQIPIIYSNSINFPAEKSIRFSISDETIVSISAPPLFRPPIILS